MTTKLPEGVRSQLDLLCELAEYDGAADSSDAVRQALIHIDALEKRCAELEFEMGLLRDVEILVRKGDCCDGEDARTTSSAKVALLNIDTYRSSKVTP